MNSEIHIFKTYDKLSKFFAEILREESLDCGQINIALSGGNTPKKLFNFLVEKYHAKINWEKINFFWGDERCVPPKSEESNYKMALDYLLTPLKIKKENIFRIRGEVDPFEEAERYADLLKKNIVLKRGIPVFNIVMLGLGEDGHTASIFPNQVNLINDEKITAVAVHPESHQRRITLTPTVINNAKVIVFIVTGKSKSKIVTQIIEKKTEAKNYPASLVNPGSGQLYWLLNMEAAELLDSSSKRI